MKKYLLLFVGLLLTAPYSEAEAKAVKLGRGSAYSVAADSNVNTGASGTNLRKGECEVDTECSATQKCMNYKCVDVCTQPTGRPGMSMARICNGQKCIPDPSRPHTFKCVDACYNVVCKSGYTTEVSGNGCCCVATSCPSGQRLQNGTCVANCSGVTCKSGYKAVSNSTGCCCKADTPTCSSGYSYNATYKGCIKDTLTCNIGCAVNGCGIGSTLRPSSGYYITSNGNCPACSSAIANCATCTLSRLGATPVCTSCKSGYRLSSGKCVKDYQLNPITPVKPGNCPNNLQDCGSIGCCPTGKSCSYYSSQQSSGGLYMCLKKATDIVRDVAF